MKPIAKGCSCAFQSFLGCAPHGLGYRRAVLRICSSGHFSFYPLEAPDVPGLSFVSFRSASEPAGTHRVGQLVTTPAQPECVVASPGVGGWPHGESRAAPRSHHAAGQALRITPALVSVQMLAQFVQCAFT
jgi:hypothetical protein